MSDLRRINPADSVDAGLPMSPPLVGGGALVDVRSLALALRSRWRFLVGAALLATLLAVVFSLSSPPPPTARASILLRYPSGYDPIQAVITEVELVKTRAVAERAATRLGPGVTADALVAGLHAEAVSQQLVRLDMVGPNGREAVRRAQAVAEAFLAFRNNLFDQQTQASVGALEQRQTSLQNDLNEINRQIDAQPSARAGDASVRTLGDLLAARAAVTEQLSKLRQQIDTATLDNTAVTSRSRIVDPAADIGRQLGGTTVRNVGTGLVLGLFLSAAWIVVMEIIGDRTRRREQVMAALEAPVAVSAGYQSGPLVVHRHRFERQRLRPSADISHIVYHLRQTLALDASSRPTLAVISVASDSPAAVAVSSLAVQLSDEGRGVLVVDFSERSVLPRLLHGGAGTVIHTADDTSMTCAVFLPGAHRVTVDPQRADIRFEDLRKNADVVIVLASLDPALGAHFLTGLVSTAVAFVTAGRSSTTALRSAAAMLAAADVTLDSAVLLGSDPSDETLGVPGPSPSPPSAPMAAVKVPPLRSGLHP